MMALGCGVDGTDADGVIGAALGAEGGPTV